MPGSTRRWPKIKAPQSSPQPLWTPPEFREGRLSSPVVAMPSFDHLQSLSQLLRSITPPSVVFRQILPQLRLKLFVVILRGRAQCRFGALSVRNSLQHTLDIG